MARGIGYATAERMLISGAEVSLWDIDSKALETASAALSDRGKVTAEEVELTDEASVDRATRSVVKQHGKIDILVNNAGIIPARITADTFAKARASLSPSIKRTGQPLCAGLLKKAHWSLPL